MSPTSQVPKLPTDFLPAPSSEGRVRAQFVSLATPERPRPTLGVGGIIISSKDLPVRANRWGVKIVRAPNGVAYCLFAKAHPAYME